MTSANTATTFTTVRLSEEAYRRLTMLKLAWKLASYDAVLLRITEPHRGEELKALNVQVRLD